MAKRARLTWNRNQDIETKFYRIYRSESPNINELNRLEHLVMRVDHSDEITPTQVLNETLSRYSTRTYLLEHKNILLDYNGVSYPFILRVDGNIETAFTLDTIEGTVLFDEPLEGMHDVTVDEYTFDGVRVWDYGETEDGKVYYGPEAKDLSSPSAPSSIRMQPDYDKNRVVIQWAQSSPTGKKFYYRIDALIDSGRYSGLSEWRTAEIKERLADRPYIIEKSLDGIAWKEIAKIQQNVFYEYMMDREAPAPVKNLDLSIYMYRNESKAQITLSWDKPYDLIMGNTPMYRVRAVNRLGAVSEPSATVGPIPFQVGLKEIVIRRKENTDNRLPTFDGADSITVGVIEDMNITHLLDDVEDNKEYIYGVWVIDKANNRSLMEYVKIFVGDTTAPSAPINLTAEEFSLSVG